ASWGGGVGGWPEGGGWDKAANPAPAKASAMYGNAGITSARPSRTISTGAAALPIPSSTIIRRSGSNPAVRRPPIAMPGPSVKSNQPNRNLTGSGNGAAISRRSGHAHAPAIPPIVTRTRIEDDISYRRVGPSVARSSISCPPRGTHRPVAGRRFSTVAWLFPLRISERDRLRDRVLAGAEMGAADQIEIPRALSATCRSVRRPGGVSGSGRRVLDGGSDRLLSC